MEEGGVGTDSELQQGKQRCRKRMTKEGDNMKEEALDVEMDGEH